MIGLMQMTSPAVAMGPNEREIQVKVTLWDIWKGRPGQPSACPVARAIRRALGEDIPINVSHTEIYIGKLPKSYFVQMPFKVKEFIRNFDSNGGWGLYRPLKFTITLPMNTNRNQTKLN